MSVPDHRHVPQKLHATGLYNLKTKAGHDAFTDAVVDTLHAVDPDWRHLKKSSGQTNIHRHGEDSALYLLPNNQAQAVDFIGGAGGPNPQPSWGPDPSPLYTHADAHDPTNHGIGAAPAPTPSPMPPYPGDAVFDQVGTVLFADYAEAGQAPNPQMGRWFGRTIYDWLAKVTPTLEASIAKHRAEWRAVLGLP